MEEIKLSVTRQFIKMPEEKSLKLILESQNSKCNFCKIDISQHEKYHAVSSSEFIALCSICYASQHLEILNSENDGVIIMSSELSQLDLIVLSRTIEMIKRLNPEEFSEDIDSSIVIRMFLEEGANNAELYFAEGSSDIELISQVLSNQTEKEYEQRSEGLYTMKWLPNYDSFSTELDYWYNLMMKEKDSQYHPSKWESMLQKMKKNKKV